MYDRMREKLWRRRQRQRCRLESMCIIWLKPQNSILNDKYMHGTLLGIFAINNNFVVVASRGIYQNHEMIYIGMRREIQLNVFSLKYTIDNTQTKTNWISMIASIETNIQLRINFIWPLYFFRLTFGWLFSFHLIDLHYAVVVCNFLVCFSFITMWFIERKSYELWKIIQRLNNNMRKMMRVSDKMWKRMKNVEINRQQRAHYLTFFYVWWKQQ